jgi:hypothetical protein
MYVDTRHYSIDIIHAQILKHVHAFSSNIQFEWSLLRWASEEARSVLYMQLEALWNYIKYVPLGSMGAQLLFQGINLW